VTHDKGRAVSTKNNPGKYDCYAKAAPDEPMFVLLARDPLAPTLVRLWAEQQSNGKIEKVRESLDCARAMDVWRLTHPPEMKP
jgi:hypothetical protein